MDFLLSSAPDTWYEELCLLITAGACVHLTHKLCHLFCIHANSLFTRNEKNQCENCVVSVFIGVRQHIFFRTSFCFNQRIFNLSWTFLSLLLYVSYINQYNITRQSSSYYYFVLCCFNFCKERNSYLLSLLSYYVARRATIPFFAIDAPITN